MLLESVRKADLYVQGKCVARPVALTATFGYAVLILEWCGNSLSTLSSQELTELSPMQLCMDGLRQVHSAGVVHGDLALRNIAHRESVFTILDWETSSPYDEEGGRRDEEALRASFPR